MATGITHILNGDGTFAPFSDSGIPGQVLVWREILSEGPIGTFETVDELQSIRSPFLEQEFGSTAADYQKKVVEVWHELPFPNDELEVVLWFEHDLFCQINLVFLTQLLYKRGFQSLSVVSPDSHPEVPNFRGMGQLSPKHFPDLFSNRRKLQKDDLVFASDFWAAWSSPTPQELLGINWDVAGAWPHLKEALQIHFQLFPSIGNGLNQIENWLLKQVQASPKTKGNLFQAFCLSWDRFGWGDLQFFNVVQRMKDLLEETEVGYSITLKGKRVLKGKLHRFEALPEPVQIGNVTCTGKQAEWRWNETEDTLVLI